MVSSQYLLHPEEQPTVFQRFKIGDTVALDGCEDDDTWILVRFEADTRWTPEGEYDWVHLEKPDGRKHSTFPGRIRRIGPYRW